MSELESEIGVWVIAHKPAAACLERMGDARRIANDLQLGVGVLLIDHHGVRLTREFQDISLEDLGGLLVRHGADLVLWARSAGRENSPSANGEAVTLSALSKVETTVKTLQPFKVQLVLAGGDPESREWAALLAAQQGWELISPALMVEIRPGRRIVTRLDHTGRKSCRVEVESGVPVVVTMRAGVAEACAPDDERTGTWRVVQIVGEANSIPSQFVPADPATVDIRNAPRLVAGGRGLGSKQGFELLREVAELLDAGIAASRMAVDLGWIEYERQVGQTGKTVSPSLYLACGISGTSHHMEGLLDAQHIIAINTDAESPIMKKADLGLIADLYPVLQTVRHRLEKQRVS